MWEKCFLLALFKNYTNMVSVGAIDDLAYASQILIADEP
jgi:hypothetical protein